jgi:hypothetical protein
MLRTGPLVAAALLFACATGDQLEESAAATQPDDECPEPEDHPTVHDVTPPDDSRCPAPRLARPPLPAAEEVVEHEVVAPTPEPGQRGIDRIVDRQHEYDGCPYGQPASAHPAADQINPSAPNDGSVAGQVFVWTWDYFGQQLEVSWGDGTRGVSSAVENWQEAEHRYAANGVYDLTAVHVFENDGGEDGPCTHTMTARVEIASLADDRPR